MSTPLTDTETRELPRQQFVAFEPVRVPLRRDLGLCSM